MLLFQCRLLHNKFGAQQHECGCTVASRGGEHLCNASAQFNIREGWHFYVHAQTEGIRRMHQIHILLSVRRAVNMLKNFATMTWSALKSLWIFSLPWMEGALRCRSTYDHIKILWFLFSGVVLPLENATLSHQQMNDIIYCQRVIWSWMYQKLIKTGWTWPNSSLLV